MNKARYFLIGSITVSCLVVFLSCVSAPERLFDQGSEVMRKANTAESDEAWIDFRPRLEKAKQKPDTAFVAVELINDWASFYLRRGEYTKALPLLDEADAVSLTADQTRYHRKTAILRAIAIFLGGNPDSALAMLEKARSMRNPGYDDEFDPNLGYAEVWMLQSLGRYQDATEAGRPYLSDKYAPRLDLIRSVLAWNAIHAGKPEEALRFNKTYDCTEPHRKLIAYIAQLQVTGPEGAEWQAKAWLEYGFPKTRRDWLIREDYIAFPIDDPEAFFRVEVDKDLLMAQACYSIALGPNNLKKNGSGLDYVLPVSYEEAIAAGNPYAIDIAWAEAVMVARHSSAFNDEKMASYQKAESLGTSLLPWGMAAYASFLLFERFDSVRAEELCAHGSTLFPENRAPFSLILAQKASREGEFERCYTVLRDIADKPMTSLDQDRVLLGLATFFASSGSEAIQEARDYCAKSFPESAALPYYDALSLFLKEGTNPFIRTQLENSRNWFYSSGGNPREALLFEWFNVFVGKK